LSPRLEGRVVRAHSNVYFVDVGEEVLECRPRGRLRYQDERVLAGDLVEVTRAGEGLGAIEAVLPRRNRLDRPPVANVDQVVVVFSLREPDLDLLLLDRFLVLIAESDLPAVLCLNKTDLAGAGESEEVLRVYRPLLGQALATSARTGSWRGPAGPGNRPSSTPSGQASSCLRAWSAGRPAGAPTRPGMWPSSTSGTRGSWPTRPGSPTWPWTGSSRPASVGSSLTSPASPLRAVSPGAFTAVNRGAR